MRRLEVAAPEGLVASLRVTNTGGRAGSEAVQLYVSGPEWPELKRLAGFAKVSLEPGESKVVGIEVDPRLLSVWSTGNPGWTRRRGDYTLSVARSSRDVVDAVTVNLTENHLPPEWKP